jgi:hypothetical protein
MARKLDRSDNQEPTASDTKDPPPSARTDDGRSLLARRTFLELGSAAVATLSSTAAVVGALRPTVSRHGIEFRRTTGAVADLGMDPTGEEPVNEALARSGDGDLIQFPDGTYRFGTDSPGLSVREETRGFEGVGENVSVVPPQNSAEDLLDGRLMDGVYLADIDIDQRGSNTPTGLRFNGDSVVVENLGVAEGGIRPAGTETLTIVGTTTANYEITVDGDLNVAGDAADGYGPSGAHSEGVVGADPITFRIDGLVTDFRLDGDGAVFVNGDSVSPEVVGQGYPHRLVFDGSDRPTAYTFSTAQLSPRAPRSDTETRVTRDQTERLDRYRFDGGVDSLTAQGSARLSFGSTDRQGGCSRDAH